MNICAKKYENWHCRFLPLRACFDSDWWKNCIDIICFVIDIINFINSGAEKCWAYLGFYHSHCSWFGRFELDSRHGYRPFCGFILDHWWYSALLFCVLVITNQVLGNVLIDLFSTTIIFISQIHMVKVPFV